MVRYLTLSCTGKGSWRLEKKTSHLKEGGIKMGAAVSTTVADAVQTAVNRTYQSANNECTATCNQLISGNVIVLDNSKAGDITFTQRCTGDASCYMKNALE